MKKLRSFIVLLIIINLIVLIVLVVKKPDEKNDYSGFSKEEYTEAVKPSIFNNKLIPQGISELSSKYSGDINLQVIYEKLYNLVIKTIPELALLENTNQENEYYKANLESLKNNCCIISQNDYNTLVEAVKKINTSDFSYLYCEYSNNSYNSDKNEFVITVYFNNDKTLNIRIILNETTNEAQFIPIEGEI